MSEAEAKTPAEVHELEEALAALQQKVAESLLERAALTNHHKFTTMQSDVANQEAVRISPQM